LIREIRVLLETIVRVIISFVLCVSWASAQLTDAEKKATTAFIATLRDDATGGYRVDAKAAPSLRATAGAVRALAALGSPLTNASKATTAKYVQSHYSNGGFAESGTKPDVTMTSVGLLAAGALGLPLDDKFEEYLHTNAKSFEEVRIGAAGLEAMGRKPKWLEEWVRIADGELNTDGTAGRGDGRARQTASVAAMKLRLGYPVANKAKVVAAIVDGQRPDGGWGKAGAAASDLETTYRVMRALHLLKEKPKDEKSLNQFLNSCRSRDGGYGIEKGQPSTMSGVYYGTAIAKWMEK
jgi:prenyltransferase beta subunit